MRVRVSAEVRPSEDEGKVKRAILNLFPLLELRLEGGMVVGESQDVASIQKFRQTLRVLAILDTARAVLKRGVEGSKTKFLLNKQAAFMGKISFTDGESPLGPIVVEIEAPDLERLIDFISPRTKDGKPIEEIQYP
ncbi:MAG: RNA-binding domain-containing protein [Candidatus Hadarchaeales archaeon]